MHTFSQLIILALMLVSLSAQASECYHYHTKKDYKIIIENGKPYMLHTVTDPNGYSIAEQEKFKLNNIDIENLQIVNANNDGIIVCNNNAYYWFDKNPYTFKDYGLVKIVSTSDVMASFEGVVFLVNGKWQIMNFNIYDKKTTWEEVKNFPMNPRLLAHYEKNNAKGYLICDNENVYAFNASDATCTVIKNLDPQTTKTVAPDYYLDSYFLFDDNTFYLTDIEFGNLEDITSEFKDNKSQKPFTDAKMENNIVSGFIDFGDGTIWAYVSAGISLDDGTDVHFYPVGNAQRFEKSGLFFAKGQYYNGSWDMVYKYHPIDMSQVLAPQELALSFGENYYDGKATYRKEYKEDDIVFRKINPTEIFATSANQVIGPVTSYRHGLPAYFINDQHLILWNFSENKIVKKIPFSKPVKDLKLAFAFDDKILIEDTLIENIGEYNTIEFVGSTVDVITGCDGGEGQHPVEVEYNYFFRDRSSVYKYHTGQKQMVRSAIDANSKLDFEQLRKL